MQLTAEQQAIVESTGDIRINAVAGSGKTTTVIEYARARPESRILYLAFNKAVKMETARRFEALGLHHVKVETAHSLAYKHIVFRHQYKVRAQGYKTTEIVSLLNLPASGERHAEYILANHINKFVSYFCNSDKQRVQDLNYLDIVTDKQAIKFVKIITNKLNSIHGYCWPKWIKAKWRSFMISTSKSSSCPLPGYLMIIFSLMKGRTLPAAMLDVFFKQPATKVIVGDTHQQIYGWRFAVNSLEKANFKTYHLSTSFRFGQDIANLALRVLTYKQHIDQEEAVTINGQGENKELKSKAVIARSNLGLLLAAIGHVQEGKLKKIYFEGNINSYTYADEGTSLYDVLNLYNDKRAYIKDSLITGMKDMKDLEEYIDKTEDMQLSMMVEVVKEYGDEIPAILKKIRDKHVPDGEKDKAEMFFSTVHRCKGIEYDEVHLADDFITEERLKKLREEKKEEMNISKLNEEINLLYVAVTRAKVSIFMPELIMPDGLAYSAHVKTLPITKRATYPASGSLQQGARVMSKPYKTTPATRTYSYERVRDDHQGAYTTWTNELDDELTIMYGDGVSIADIAEHFGRTKVAVIMRIKKLRLDWDS
ncbi:3'-5' exonuclease [Paraflavitalea speifideaquila]|uniref:3'-5' exonuclease n=1 Tax=Paraflavitalea speifideaquila TaxID=3076558 RepID=UPI0028E56284|nr:3'-5' exonuclease [Paraflavitalea speifideiaquila]